MRGPWLMAVLLGAWIAAAGGPTQVAGGPSAPRAALDRPPASVALRAAAPRGRPARRALARPSARSGAAVAGQLARSAHGRAGAALVQVAAVPTAPLVAVRAAATTWRRPAHAAGRTLAGGGSAPRAPPRAPA